MTTQISILGHIQFRSADQTTQTMVPLYLEHISAGFPSPADGHIFEQVDVHDYLVRNPGTTFFMRVGGDSMEGAGINTGDILVVDKSELAEPGKLVVVALNGRFTLRRLIKWQDQFQLVAENPKYKPIVIPVYSSFEAWGVVVGLVRKL